jgi:hypothetical protein
MNPIRLWKIYRKANRLGNLLEEGRMKKSLWKSKTFWFNVLTAAGELAQVIPLPPGTTILITNVINIGLRLITKEPVKVV